MKTSARMQLRLATASFVVLFVVIIGLLMWLSKTYHAQFDWTRSGRNTLAPASVALLERLDGPVRVTAFARRRPEGMESAVRELVARYQRQKKDISLELINPDSDPARARAAGVQFDGEIVIEYRGNHETITQATEENVTNALARLARSGERWIVFLAGHGERRPDKDANHDYSIWAEQLAKRGLKTRTLLLSENPQIPQNTSVLVIADPRTRLLPGEVKQIETYLAQGGNLLWLVESGGLQGLERVAESLGVEIQRGTIVDPASQLLTGNDATFLVIGKYGQHPIVRNLAAMTLFPQAVALSARNSEKDKDGWQREVVLDTLPSSWSETGGTGGKIHFDAGKDARGPLTLALALARDVDKRKQRVVVVGDADFLSNAFIGNGANVDLGMNLANWASSDETYIDLPARSASDQSLALSGMAQAIIAFGFLIILPLFLLSTGIVLWWRRRRR